MMYSGEWAMCTRRLVMEKWLNEEVFPTTTQKTGDEELSAAALSTY